jgi:hypothetical protein
VVAHALFFIVIPKIACGEGVHRDFERSLKYLPLVIDTPEKRRSAKNGKWPSLREVAGSEVAAKYVFPVLFPLDLIMMAFLAAFLAAGSVTFAAYVPWVPNRIGLLIALPILYFVVDLAEDTLLAWLLRNPEAVQPDRVGFLKFLTVAKFVSLTAAYVQCALLAVLALYAWIRTV